MAEAIEVAERPALKGAELIRDLVTRLPNEPGVYRMLDEKGEVLYVGKAKSLKKRVAAYTKPQALSRAPAAHGGADPRDGVRDHRPARSRRCCSRPT